MVLTIAIVGLAGTTVLVKTHAQTAATASASCTYYTDHTVVSYSWSGITTGNGVDLKRDGSGTASKHSGAAQGSDTYSDSAVAPGQSHSYQVIGQGGQTLANTGCTTPSASISCTAYTDHIAISFSWSGITTGNGVDLKRDNSSVVLKHNGAASGNDSYSDTSVSGGDSHSYQVVGQGGQTWASMSCTTPKPQPAPVAPASAPPAASSPAPSSSSSTSTAAVKPTSTPAQTTSTSAPSPKPLAAKPSTTTQNVNVVAPKPTNLSSTSTNDTPVADAGSTTTDTAATDVATDASDDTTDATGAASTSSEPATRRAPKQKSNAVTGGLGISFGIVLLLALIGGLVFFVLRRRSQAAQAVDSDNYYSFPSASSGPALPPATAPIATNELERQINQAFYPGQTHDGPLPPVEHTNEPEDMFELAKQHPETFGNPHYVQGSSTPMTVPLGSQPDLLPLPLPPLAAPSAPEPLAGGGLSAEATDTLPGETEVKIKH